MINYIIYVQLDRITSKSVEATRWNSKASTPTRELKDNDLDAPASMWMPSSPRRPAVTLTFDLQNIMRSSVGASDYFLSFVIEGRGTAYSGPQRWDLYVGPMRQWLFPVSFIKIVETSERYRGNNIWLGKRTNRRQVTPCDPIWHVSFP